MTEESNVSPLPLRREQATEIVRNLAEDSTRWVVTVPYTPEQGWRRLVNMRQIEFCLKDGYMLENEAKLDEHGNWRFRLAQVCGGLNIVIEVALERGPNPRLYVVAIDGDEI